MARRRRSTARRKTARRNPSARKTVRRGARRAARYAKGTLAGMNIRDALKNAPPQLVGMFAAKWAAKRFGGGATETDPQSWNWRSYMQMGIGALGAGFLVQALSQKRTWGQKTLEGGITLMLYKLVQNELVAGNAWATGAFGEDEPEYLPTEYMGESQYLQGNVYPGTDGRPYLLGEDNQWYPIDDDARLSDDLVPVGPLGDDLVPVGPLGEDKWGRALLGQSDPYTEAFF